jgi:hypothetical protein
MKHWVSSTEIDNYLPLTKILASGACLLGPYTVKMIFLIIYINKQQSNKILPP